MKNFKTTILGVFTILAAVGNAGVAVFDNDPKTEFSLPVTAALVSGGVGLILAKDAKSSDDAK